MQYKTIALELIRDRPELYERLRSTKRLLPAMDAYALDLKADHETWKEAIRRLRPGGDLAQASAEALELAIRDLRYRLHFASPSDEPVLYDPTSSRRTPPE